MDEIMPGLYLGSMESIPPNLPDLRSRGITHVLTLMDSPLPGSQGGGGEGVGSHGSLEGGGEGGPGEGVLGPGGLRLLHIFAQDLSEHDLLQDLEMCLDFVERGRQAGGVLVHCQSGVSRSAAVVVAYVMRTNSMSRMAALEFVRSRRPVISPNDGFQQQLELFERMGCRVNEKHEEFRRYTLSKLASRCATGFREDELPSSIYRPESSPVTASDTVYKCKKCRRTLFLTSDLLPHTKGQGEAAFDWRSKIPASQRPQGHGNEEDDEEEETCQVSLFVEPLMWMKGLVESIEGKLSCPKCSAKLGSFVWYGERCPCGAWVAPAFHIQTSKVDAMRPRIFPPSASPALPSATPTLSAASNALPSASPAMPGAHTPAS